MKKLAFITIPLLLVSAVAHAQWTNTTPNISNTNTGSVTIGSTTPYTIHASSALFPAATPKLEVITGIGGSTPFADVITIRRPGVTSDVMSRQLGIIFKLSSESSTIETDKMGGLLFESTGAYANLPTMSLVTANVRRLTIDQNTFLFNLVGSDGINTERMRINSAGNVGIGTTTPLYKLDVNGNANFGGGTAQGRTVLIKGAGATAPNGAGGLLLSTATGGLDIFATSTDANPVWDFRTFASEQLSFSPGSIERMRINAAGNVGIGTTAPVSTFQVNNATSKFSVGNAGGADLNYGTAYIGFNAARIGTGSASSDWTIDGDGYHNGGGVIYTDVAGNVYIAPIVSTGATTQTLADADIKSRIAFRVSGTGNVGIGTTDNGAWSLNSSSYKLAVGGGMIATTVTVKPVANWPDYVFKKDYTLPSLSEVKTYIDQNQHLPEIPSAQEVKKDGINLGEMNKLLLKKVEELTLYLIEKDKQDAEKNALLRSLQARVSELEKTKSK